MTPKSVLAKQIFGYINRHPLASKHKFKAYFRFIYWQLSQLVYKHEQVYSFVGKTKLVVKKGLTGATGNIYTGLHEFTDMSFLLHFLRKEDLFADIGANVGSYTILASGHIGSKTLAFEPIPSTFDWLKKNIRVNGIEQVVKAHNIGLGSQKKILSFTQSYDTVNHVLLDDEKNIHGKTINVQVERFDDIALTEGIPSLIKIDVEGFEEEVIKGMEQVIRDNKLKAIIIELNGLGRRYGNDEQTIHNYLVENRFNAYEYNPFKRELIAIKNFGPYNTIYIRDLDFVKNRIETANKVKVFSETF